MFGGAKRGRRSLWGVHRGDSSWSAAHTGPVGYVWSRIEAWCIAAPAPGAVGAAYAPFMIRTSRFVPNLEPFISRYRLALKSA